MHQLSQQMEQMQTLLFFPLLAAHMHRSHYSQGTVHMYIHMHRSHCILTDHRALFTCTDAETR